MLATGGLPLALLALASSAFAIGTTEFVPTGLLPEIAAEFHVDIPAATPLRRGRRRAPVTV